MLDYSASDGSQEGPPLYFAGQGSGQPGSASSTGTLKILAILVNPSDRKPAKTTETRNKVVTALDNVKKGSNENN